MGITSTSEVMLCRPQKSSISWVSRQAANGRAGKAATRHDEAECGQGQRLFRRANQRDVAVAAEQVDVGVDVVVGGDGIQDEVEAAGVLRHFVGIAGEDDLIGAQAEGIVLLAGRSGEDHGVRAEAWANLTPMCPSPPRPTTPTFLPL